MARHDLAYTFLLDETGSVGKGYNIFATPTTFFLSPDGVIRAVAPGVVRSNWFDTQLASLN